jgi:hypothetical protein
MRDKQVGVREPRGGEPRGDARGSWEDEAGGEVAVEAGEGGGSGVGGARAVVVSRLGSAWWRRGCVLLRGRNDAAAVAQHGSPVHARHPGLARQRR